MGRRGSISFVIEVKRSRRRLPLALGRTEDPNGKGEVRFGAVRPSGFAATPFGDGPRGYDPTVEAAKVAADRLFNRLSGSESAPAPAWNDLGARNADVAPGTQAAGIPVPAPASDSSSPRSPSTQAAQPRTGRVLESLTSVNPLEALFRQKAEERAARPRRPRVARSAAAAEPQAGVRPDSKPGAASKSATDAKGLLEAVVDPTDPKEARRSRSKSRRKTAAKRFAKELGRQSRRKGKTTAKSRRRATSQPRTAKPLAGPKRSARKGLKAAVSKKRTTIKKARKVLARKPAPRKGATRKTAVRNAAKASKLRKTSTKRTAARGRASTRGRRR